MTKQELDALESLANAASEGPWRCSEDDPNDVWVFAPHLADDKDFVANVGGSRVTEMGVVFDLDQHNGRLVAASRTAIPALVAEVRRLKDDINEAWDATGTTDRGTNTLAELIDQLRLDNAELREQVQRYDLQLNAARTLTDELQQVLKERSTG